jgi:hypothetical protein
MKGATYVLEYAGKAYYTLCQRGDWDKCLQQAPGESAMINPHSHHDESTSELKCFNCGGPHHLRRCPKPRDQSTIDKNRNIHPTGHSPRQPTGFRGGGKRWSRPTKWRLPEDGENNKRIIDNKPFTFNPTSKRWEPDTAPESGQQQLPAANVAPATTPSATQPPVPPSSTTLPALPIMQGAFFNNGYGNPSPDNKEAQKQAIAQQMIQLKQVWESM